jgi:hypothetical protein
MGGGGNNINMPFNKKEKKGRSVPGLELGPSHAHRMGIKRVRP